ARRRALLRPGRARRATRPALARQAAARPATRPAARRGRASTAGRSGRLLRLHDQRRRERGGRRRERAAAGLARGGVAAVRAPRPARVPAHTAAPSPHVWVLHRPAGIIRRMSWDDWIRTVEVEPSLYAADFSRLGEQVA